MNFIDHKYSKIILIGKTMKHVYKLLLLLCVVMPSILKAQVINSGFELWTGENPDNWETSNFTLIALPITKSTESHSGTFAVKGEVTADLSGGEIFIPLLTSIPVSSPLPKYSAMELYYQFNPLGGDVLTITVLMYNDITLVGGGAVVIYDKTSGYTRLSIPIDYFLEGEPNYCMIVIGAGNEDEEIAGTVGTWFLVDDVSFGGTTGIDDKNDNKLPEGFSLEQNYPNPFNPSTTIEFSLPLAAEVSLKVYNMLGQEVASLIDQKVMSDGHHRIQWDADNLSNGTYIYSITADNFTFARKMILLK